MALPGPQQPAPPLPPPLLAPAKRAPSPPARRGRPSRGPLDRLWHVPDQVVLLVVLAAGAVLGACFPNPKLAYPYSVLQSATGWAYTLAWSASFYTQVFLNWRRKKVTGLSFDFLALNLLGWAAYTTFNLVIFFVFECPAVKPSARGGAGAGANAAGASAAAASPSSLALRPGFLGAGPRAADLLAVGTTDFCQYAVEVNDVVFSLHALALTLVTLLQCCVYPRGKQRVHGLVQFAIAAAVAAAAVYAGAIYGQWRLGGALGRWLQKWMQWVYWLYFLSYIKMGVTLVKYVPQAVFNFKRRSTQGWSILNILLDFMGGALSLGQQLLTCYWTGNWEPVTANPVKLGLAVTSMIMDVLFMFQHYVLYAEPANGAGLDGAASGQLPLISAGPGRPQGVAAAAVILIESDEGGSSAEEEGEEEGRRDEERPAAAGGDGGLRQPLLQR